VRADEHTVVGVEAIGARVVGAFLRGLRWAGAEGVVGTVLHGVEKMEIFGHTTINIYLSWHNTRKIF